MFLTCQALQKPQKENLVSGGGNHILSQRDNQHPISLEQQYALTNLTEIGVVGMFHSLTEKHKHKNDPVID